MRPILRAIGVHRYRPAVVCEDIFVAEQLASNFNAERVQGQVFRRDSEWNIDQFTCIGRGQFHPREVEDGAQS